MAVIDALGLENTYASALEGFYVPMMPAGFPEPNLVVLNRPLLDALGLNAGAVEPIAARLFSGTDVPADAVTLAQAYAGHQFGGFSAQLGDGRAVLLGEVVDPQGVRRDLQLKGSGPTAFSRGGDGKATLGPVLREYLMGEAMHHLGIPTTRALAAVTTGETVYRSEPLPGAVLARVAASHLRVGTAQFFAARGDTEKLRRLVDYSLARHFPDRVGAENPAQALLEGVAGVQATLIAKWLHVGFIHGVMNTDNATLSGETIDYGPCAFMDTYDPATVYSSIDRQGRYAYGNQPRMGQWNVARLADALLTLLSPDEAAAISIAEGALSLYATTHERAWLDGMRRKIGIEDTHADDATLVTDLLANMGQMQRDYTGTFRELAAGLLAGKAPFADNDFEAWNTRWLARLDGADLPAVAARMNQVNPVYIPRNHLVEAALDAAIAGDLTPFETLMSVLSNPYEAQPGREAYAEPAPATFGPYRTFCGT
ncbi:MAG: hypothetical protein ACI9MR_003262 [Myxococcota bacterium]|jgi:uncharacterized protein YdiU (UPF0061 family)